MSLTPPDLLQPQETQTELFPISQIALVRALSGPPRIENGEIILETAYQATQAGRSLKKLGDEVPPHPIPRITLHFSLNDCVADTSNGYNSWKAHDFVVVAGLGETLSHNPECTLMNLLGADSYFEVPTKSPFRLPKGSILIMPQRGRSDGSIPQPDNIVTYKSTGFSDEEIQEMLDARADRSPISTFIHDDRVFDQIEDFADHIGVDAGPPYTGIIEGDHFCPDFETFVTNRGFDLDEYYRKYLLSLTKDFAKRKAVQAVLSSHGYPILPSGDDRWQDSGADHKLKETAKSLGVSSHRHTRTFHEMLEKRIIDSWGNPQESESVLEIVRQSPEKITPALHEMLEEYEVLSHS